MSVEKVVLALSGPTGVGKTTLAEWLVANALFAHVSTSQILKERHPERVLSRRELQKTGNNLDLDTDYGWISEATSDLFKRSENLNLVVDAVRKPKQVAALRAKLGDRVLHCHLYATDTVLKSRHLARNRSEDLGLTHSAIQTDESEAHHKKMLEISDLSYECFDDEVMRLGRKLLHRLTDMHHFR